MKKDNKQEKQDHDQAHTKPDEAEIILSERLKASQLQTSDHSVFLIDDSFYRSRTPKSSHWSVAWSDLMMTMFILFLTLFIYQLAHREFLKEDSPAVIAGSTIEIPTPITKTKPFFPIFPTFSAKQGIVLKKAEDFQDQEVFVNVPPAQKSEPEPDDLPRASDNNVAKNLTGLDMLSKNLSSGAFMGIPSRPLADEVVIALPDADIIEPNPLGSLITKSQTVIEKSDAEPPQKKLELITQIYDLSKYTLLSEKLEKFASVELIPDKTVKIILTGDLLFSTGKALLTDTAKESLSKLAPIIRKTPYMISVVGHTDSVPMHSAQFPTNWELSVARASRVARFLIEQIGIPGKQLEVSGYAYHRPVRLNNNEKNKKANRRVEIILSKKPLPANLYKANNLFN